jgi:hypothetical protein
MVEDDFGELRPILPRWLSDEQQSEREFSTSRPQTTRDRRAPPGGREYGGVAILAVIGRAQAPFEPHKRADEMAEFTPDFYAPFCRHPERVFVIGFEVVLDTLSISVKEG